MKSAKLISMISAISAIFLFCPLAVNTSFEEDFYAQPLEGIKELSIIVDSENQFYISNIEVQNFLLAALKKRIPNLKVSLRTLRQDLYLGLAVILLEDEGDNYSGWIQLEVVKPILSLNKSGRRFQAYEVWWRKGFPITSSRENLREHVEQVINYLANKFGTDYYKQNL